MHPTKIVPGNGMTPLLECPECGKVAVSTKMTPHTFDYGHGSQAIQITVTLPLRVCCQCGFEYYDKESQDARHEAVCKHLGVLTPAQIRQLRQFHNMSRSEFAALTGLGEATIARWERGALVQNPANDKY